MAFNGSGLFTRLYNWVTEQASSPIEIAKLDTQEEDFATALNNCLTRDGQGKPSANIDWNNKNLSGVATLTATSGTISTLTAGLTTNSATACAGSGVAMQAWHRNCRAGCSALPTSSIIRAVRQHRR